MAKISRVTDVKISYGLYDKTAAEDGVMNINDIQPFSDITELIDEKNTIQKWMTLEGEGCSLDGTFLFLPEDIAGEFMGVWSQELSGAAGTFTQPPIFTVHFSLPHTSAGITLLFSESTDDWCNELTVTWLGQAGDVMLTKDFTPNSGKYFCESQVENYYGLQITFRSTNKPNHFLKLTGIRYGMLMDIDGSNLISCNILEEVNPVSSEVSINTMNFSFHSEKGEFDLLDLTGAYVLFQQRQSITVTGYIDGIRMNMGTFYLDKPKSTDNVVSMECIDLLGVMDDTEYLGGLWLNGISAKSLIDDIMKSADISSDNYQIAEELQNITVTGYLPICTHRAALQQVAFAIGAVVDCSRSEKIKITTLITNNPKTIPLDRKIVGRTQENTALVTGVEVYTHHYSLSDSITEVFKEQREIGEYVIKFSEPTTNITATGATITEQGVNYARIKVSSKGTVILSGYCYEDSTSLAGKVYMENLPANAKINIKTIENCYLTANAQSLAQRIYDYFQKRTTDTGNIILVDETAGDLVTLENKDGRALTGTIEQINIDLTGGFIAKVVVCGA